MPDICLFGQTMQVNKWFYWWVKGRKLDKQEWREVHFQNGKKEVNKFTVSFWFKRKEILKIEEIHRKIPMTWIPVVNQLENKRW